jgi:hypothetical protein
LHMAFGKVRETTVDIGFENGALDLLHHGNRLCKTRKSRTVMILVPS